MAITTPLINAASSLYYESDGEVEPKNFLISGGVTQERNTLLCQLLRKLCGKVPTLVLYRTNRRLEENIRQIFAERSNSAQLSITNDSDCNYEYLSGVTVQGTVNTLRHIATERGFNCPAQFDRTVRALIELSETFGLGKGLSGLYKMAYVPYAELTKRINAFFDPEKATQISNEIESDGPELFYMFQSVTAALALDASSCGWKYREHNDFCFSTALENNGTVLLEIDNGCSDTVLSCLYSELKELRTNMFLLVCSGVKLRECELLKLLLSNRDFRCGIEGDNIFSLIGDEDSFNAIAEKASVIMTLKHNTGPTARHFSELMGNQDQKMVSTTKGNSRAALAVLPSGVHSDESRSIENRYRVMPESIMNLAGGQVLVFDTDMNRITQIG